MNSKTKTLTRWKRFRHRLEAGAVQLLAWLIPLFSRATVQRFGYGLGWVVYRVLDRQRRISLANLDVAYGATLSRQDKERITCASAQTFMATMLGLFWAPRLKREVLDQFVVVDADSLARIRALQARGKGIIFLTLHYGDWELLGLAVAFFGFPMVVVAEEMPNRALEKMINHLRTLSGNRIIPQHSAAPKLLKALKRGQSVALLIDLNAPREGGGMWLEFFGRPVFNNIAVAGLALHTGATIVFSVAEPLTNGRTRIVFGPEITYPRTEDYQGDVRRLSQQCLDLCENKIRENPELWLWSYKRWKTSPTPDLSRFPYYTRYIGK